jgi:mannose-6-phosphate isomerase-like protein (cupin superfamily)
METLDLEPDRDMVASQKVNLLEAFSRFDEQWSPKLIAELNGQHVRLVKVEGEFVWHHHEHEDELFLVVKGRLVIELRDRTVELGEGELLVVPRGVEHRPVADEEAWILLFEPATTVNTGSAGGERTVGVGRLS